MLRTLQKDAEWDVVRVFRVRVQDQAPLGTGPLHGGKPAEPAEALGKAGSPRMPRPSSLRRTFPGGQRYSVFNPKIENGVVF